jgi:hypothetical protein
LHDNAIAAIPPNVADLTNLTTLTLSNNQVCAMRPVIAASLTRGVFCPAAVHCTRGLAQIDQVERAVAQEQPAAEVT